MTYKEYVERSRSRFEIIDSLVGSIIWQNRMSVKEYKNQIKRR